jgi:ankyrin repeat protein
MQIATLLLLTCGLVTSKNANRRATNAAKEAALKGNVESLQQAIDRGADLDDRKGRGTPLLHAVLRASPDVVGMLLAAGANPELGNLDGISPFQAAAFSNNVDVIRALVEGGVDVAAFGPDGWSALHRATWRPGEQAVAALEYLLEHIEVDVATNVASFSMRKNKRTDKSLAATAPVGATPLMEAAARGQIHMCAPKRFPSETHGSYVG